MAINELRYISTFVKTADLGSLRQAAASQGTTPQAASQALAQLEKHLGVRLFHRTTRNMQLTAEGQQFLESVRPSLAGLERALAQVRDAKDEIAGPLRIVGPRSVFRPVLAALLHEFCETHPKVQPYVHLDDRIGNWVEDRAEVGFRIGPSPVENVIARKLFPLQVIVCAAPRYLQQNGAPSRIEELPEHRCCVFRDSMSDRPRPWKLRDGDAVIEQEIVPSLCLNDEEMEIDAVLSGRVIGHLTAVTAAAHIRAGRLVPLLTQNIAHYASVFIYYGSRVSLPTRVRAFINLTIERLADNHTYVLSQDELTAAEEHGRRHYVA